MPGPTDQRPPRKPLIRPQSESVIDRDAPDDYTSPVASNRSFFVNLYFMRFGTSDRLQGAAIFLSVIFLIMVAALMIVGFLNGAWAKDALTWITSPLMLVVGVAVGRNVK